MKGKESEGRNWVSPKIGAQCASADKILREKTNNTELYWRKQIKITMMVYFTAKRPLTRHKEYSLNCSVTNIQSCTPILRGEIMHAHWNASSCNQLSKNFCKFMHLTTPPPPHPTQVAEYVVILSFWRSFSYGLWKEEYNFLEFVEKNSHGNQTLTIKNKISATATRNFF